MKRAQNKSDCPINFAVEILGDTWSLLIIRDIAALGKHTFNEFLASKERIGSSVLAGRLAHLEQNGIITKKADEQDRRKSNYALTKTGLQLLPVVYEFALWGAEHALDPEPWTMLKNHDRDRIITLWRSAILQGDSFFNGQNSVVNRLQR